MTVCPREGFEFATRSVLATTLPSARSRLSSSEFAA